jgi:hypothetical protein
MIKTKKFEKKKILCLKFIFEQNIFFFFNSNIRQQKYFV